MSNDAEHRVDSTRYEPVNELCHQRLAVIRWLFDADPYAVLALLNGEARHAIVERTWCLPSYRVVLPAVPWAHEPLAFDQPLAKWSALMGAAVRYGAETFSRIGKARLCGGLPAQQ